MCGEGNSTPLILRVIVESALLPRALCLRWPFILLRLRLIPVKYTPHFKGRLEYCAPRSFVHKPEHMPMTVLE